MTNTNEIDIRATRRAVGVPEARSRFGGLDTPFLDGGWTAAQIARYDGARTASTCRSGAHGTRSGWGRS